MLVFLSSYFGHDARSQEPKAGSFLTFRDNLWVSSSRVKQPKKRGCSTLYAVYIQKGKGGDRFSEKPRLNFRLAVSREVTLCLLIHGTLLRRSLLPPSAR